MEAEIDLHNYKRQFERQIELAKEDNGILSKNKEWILKFKDYLLSEGISYGKIGRYVLDVRKFSKMLGKNFEKANKEDIRRVVADLNQTNLSEESKKCFKIMLRKLYRFIRGIEEKGVYPEEVRWVSIGIPNNHKKLPEELLNEEEIKRIISNCGNTRDRALVSVLAETGARVSEIGTMKIKHVAFEEHGARLTIKGKTGARKVLIIWSSPFIQEWVNQHPFNNDPDAWLWYNPRGEILCYTRICAILKKAANRAGIKKRIYLHLLRHSQATKMASIMSEAAMKQYFGWTQSSKMAGIYVHMSGKDTDISILKANGIEIIKEVSESKMKPKICVKCKASNEATNKFCKICGMILDKEEQEKVLKEDMQRTMLDDVMNKLMKDKEVIDFLTNKLKGGLA